MVADDLRARFALAEAKFQLERKLRAVRFKLRSPDRERFAVARFDYAGRRLIGAGAYLMEDGTVCVV